MLGAAARPSWHRDHRGGRLARITDYLLAAVLQGRVQLDVRLESRTSKQSSRMSKRPTSVSILVNNAGITQDNLALRMKEAEWDA